MRYIRHMLNARPGQRQRETCVCSSTSTGVIFSLVFLGGCEHASDQRVARAVGVNVTPGASPSPSSTASPVASPSGSVVGTQSADARRAPGSAMSAVAAGELCPGGMVRIPAGQFLMGSTDSADKKYWIQDEFPGLSEQPVHAVSVPAFCMGLTEVTVGQYRACVYADVCTPPRDTSIYCTWNQSDSFDHPIDCVDWKQAVTYCHWIHDELPTEEQWEYAARGTDGRRFAWGNDEPANWATCDRDGLCGCMGSEGETCPVNSHPRIRVLLGSSTCQIMSGSGLLACLAITAATVACTDRPMRSRSLGGRVQFRGSLRVGDQLRSEQRAQS